jgi:hypothetical protein
MGGALTAITAAYLTQAGDTRIGTLTLLNTMLDYAEPGVLGNFTDEKTVEKLIKKISRSGTLEGASMAGTFDILRANDLIFNYVVSNWLMGQDPPSFDILAWNSDSTRMPAAMHAFYLRNFYVRNRLATGTLEIAGRTIDLSAIKSPTYVVSAINDHIPPRLIGKRSRAGPNLETHAAEFHAAKTPAPRTCDHRRTRGDPREPEFLVAGDRAAQGRHLVGRLGPLVDRDRGRHDRPAADGQRRAPGAGRRARALRPLLTVPVGQWTVSVR